MFSISRTRRVTLAASGLICYLTVLNAPKGIGSAGVAASLWPCRARRCRMRARLRRQPMRGRRIAAVIAVFVAALVVLAMASGFLVDWAWFASLRYSPVFW